MPNASGSGVGGSAHPIRQGASSLLPLLKKTPLHALHQQLGAKLVDFAGWEMPVQFDGVVEEHHTVRQRMGLFDVSHMGEFTLEGPGVLDLLQSLTPNNVARLQIGQAHYSALTTETGCFHDDILVYRVDEQSYLVVANASNIDTDFEWIRSHSGDGVDLVNRSDETALLALQGPLSQDFLDPLTDLNLSEMKYYRFGAGSVCGREVMVSRTGYTGEDGFELMLPNAEASALAEELLERGEAQGLRPIGLAARDTLRLEAKMALYGNDIDDEHTVLEADLGWIVKLKKGEFVGRSVLAKQKEHGVDRKLVGFEMIDRGIARKGYPVFVAGEQVSTVTSGTHGPHVGKAIGLTYLPIDSIEVGTEFEVEIRSRRASARVVPTPFYQREK